ncbi:Nuclear pore complex protein [Wickerhamomyces ciferrii]|uniref:Nuclear pore complex protein n=1 Tax=Wickerhamomyces ciferrii (strain ATCC 14091 / BCRC 22168 / CBS 111 / JCM 3599 / NBRC 0793 / NRRL Y-1031 F-60-10) TaxID=1206466 RepID=K0KRX5_WICCF|nr:Nuclear pore complex protein [Wickerhamomyces ciferrii]CCH44093.1 Nuclear pore complex protein [Wickerhamomyces ciferrii]
MMVARYLETNVRAAVEETLELDVARGLWSKKRLNRQEDQDPELSFKDKLTEDDTGVLTINSNTIPGKISYRIVDQRHSLVLTPLALNNNFNIKLKSIKINLPDGIRSNCLTINQFITQQDEHSIVIDLISDAGMVITILLKLSDFTINNNNNHSQLNSSNYHEWCKISNPYSFDIRIPHFLHSFSYDQSIVLLKDGGIIGLQKNPGKLEEITTIIFNDNSYFENLGNFFKPWSQSNQIKLKDSNLSPKTAIDALNFNDYLITITINKKLRIWSISKQSLILEKDLIDLISSNQKITTNKPFLDPSPTKLLDLLTINIDGVEQTYLSIFLPFGSGFFKIFQLDASSSSSGQSIDVKDLGTNFEYEATLPDSTTIWLVADFKLIKSNSIDSLDLWVLWKSNTSSIIQNLKIQQNLTFKIQWFEVSNSTQDLTKLSDSETWSEFYLRKIFESDIYSNDIISTALKIYQQHFTTTSTALEEDSLLDDLSIREKVVKTIGQNIIIDKNYDDNIKKQWSRFDTLCKEFQKQSNEHLKFHIDLDSNLIFLINRLDFSLIRKTSNSELLSQNKHLKISSIDKFDDIENHLKFLNIISNFKKSISSDVLDNVKNSLIRLINNTDTNSNIFDNLSKIYLETLNDKFNPNNLSNLVEELSSFDDIFKIIKELLSLQDGQEQQFITKGKLTKFGTSIVLNSLKDIVKINQEILFDLLILLLVLEIYKKDELELILSKILPKFKSYQILEKSLYINFNEFTNKLELDESSILENGLISKIIDLKFPTGFLINEVNLNDFINGQLIPFLNSSEFIYSISIYLISNNYSSLVYTHFLQFFDSSPIFKWLKAITFLKTNQTLKAEKIFLQNSQTITKYILKDSEKELLKSLEDFTVLFKSSLTKYYFNLAIIFLHDLKFQSALKFINLSIADNFNSEFDSEHLEEKYFVLFNIANDLSNFEISARALDNLKNPQRKKEAFETFIYGLYKNGETRVLNYFDFTSDYKLIDSILLTKAQSFPNDLKKSLFFYQTLYAFRLKYKSYRGALESLYEFIYKFQSFIEIDESVKLTIAELYSTILNLLITLPKDEQWLIYQINSNEQNVINYKELKEEQLKLTNSFSKELKLRYLS